jgi:hypothetical protein
MDRAFLFLDNSRRPRRIPWADVLRIDLVQGRNGLWRLIVVLPGVLKAEARRGDIAKARTFDVLMSPESPDEARLQKIRAHVQAAFAAGAFAVDATGCVNEPHAMPRPIYSKGTP